MVEPNDNSSRSPRFTHWVAFLVFAAITMGASIEVVKDKGGDQNAAQKYAVVCSGITFALALLVVIMHLFPITAMLIVGTKVEGVVCLALVAVWCVIVAVVSDPTTNLAMAMAEDGSVVIGNGNLYYFSWAGFVCSITLMVSYLRSAFDVDVAGEIRSRSARMNYWAGLLATSLVVMGASANLFTSKCSANSQNREDDTYCRRTKFAISLGCIGTLLALICVAAKIATSRAPFIVEAVFSFLLLIMYTLGVIYITSQYGPGAPLGNLYYFTWLSFLCSFALTASCYDDYQAAKTMAHQGQDNTQQDIHVETIDDDQI